MKSNLVFTSLLCTSLLFTSCKKEDETETAASDKPKEIIMPRVQSIPAQTYNQQAVPQTITPQPQQAVAMGQPVSTGQAPVTTKPGMNPPHGQPGHRCDIAVGAPLNSKAQSNNAGAATVQQINPNTFTTTQATTSQPAVSTPASLDPNAPVTAPGMNPPHGQPGHQCGIAVGAPLPKE